MNLTICLLSSSQKKNVIVFMLSRDLHDHASWSAKDISICVISDSPSHVQYLKAVNNLDFFHCWITQTQILHLELKLCLCLKRQICIFLYILQVGRKQNVNGDYGREKCQISMLLIFALLHWKKKKKKISATSLIQIIDVRSLQHC